MPCKLYISPNDMYYLGIKELNFSQAKFDDTLKQKESFIITSTANYTIIWSLKSIINGDLFDYEIK